MRKSIFFHDQQRVWLLVCWVFITFGCLPEEQRLTSVPAIEVDIASDTELKLSEYFENFRMLKLPTDTLMAGTDVSLCSSGRQPNVIKTQQTRSQTLC